MQFAGRRARGGIKTILKTDMRRLEYPISAERNYRIGISRHCGRFYVLWFRGSVAVARAPFNFVTRYGDERSKRVKEFRKWITERAPNTNGTLISYTTYHVVEIRRRQLWHLRRLRRFCIIKSSTGRKSRREKFPVRRACSFQDEVSFCTVVGSVWLIWVINNGGVITYKWIIWKVTRR